MALATQPNGSSVVNVQGAPALAKTASNNVQLSSQTENTVVQNNNNGVGGTGTGATDASTVSVIIN